MQKNNNLVPIMRRISVAILLCFSIFGCVPAENDELPQDQAVLVYFDYGSTDLGPLFVLEDKLEAAINDAGVGEYDGNEIAVDGSDGTLFMYGPNADSILEVIRPILESTSFTKDAQVILRYGPPEDGVTERAIRLGS
jgi:hypothetical protein